MSLLLYGLLWFVLGACAGAFAGYQVGKPTTYMGEEPEYIPEGWYKLPVGTYIQGSDRVWGYDDWYPAPTISYQVAKGDWYSAPTISYQVAKEDCFIRLETFKSPFPLEDIPPL